MASERALLNIPVDASVPWVATALGKVDRRNRKGTIGDTERYCRGGIFRNGIAEDSSEDESQQGDSTTTIGKRGKDRSIWGSHVWTKVAVASILALSLQWVTTGAAVMIVVSIYSQKSLPTC